MEVHSFRKILNLIHVLSRASKNSLFDDDLENSKLNLSITYIVQYSKPEDQSASIEVRSKSTSRANSKFFQSYSILKSF